MGARPGSRSHPAGKADAGTPVDVAIVGGGPAGAAAAGLLAAWGHSVTVFSRSGSASSRLAESLPPSTNKVLDRIGASSAVDDAGFVRSRGHTVWWGGSGLRVEEFPEGSRGYQVLRTDLDRVLLDLAGSNGAHIEADTTVHGAERDGDVHRIEYTSGLDPSTITARWVLDCSGRSGVVARHGFRRHNEGPRTLALVGIWRSEEGWEVPDPTHTLVQVVEKDDRVAHAMKRDRSRRDGG